MAYPFELSARYPIALDALDADQDLRTIDDEDAFVWADGQPPRVSYEDGVDTLILATLRTR